MFIKIHPKNKSKIFLKNVEEVESEFSHLKNWEDFAKLTDIRSGQSITKFNPYPYQIKLIELIEKSQSTIICKTRQLGITETIANYFLFYAAKYQGYLGVIFSKNQSDTSNIAKRLRRQIESLNLKTKTDSLTDIELTRGGRILFRNSTPYGSRGLESVSHILFDEASFIDEIEEIYKSALPTTSMVKDAKVILLSTPNGSNGYYYNLLSQNNDFDIVKKCDEITTGLELPFFFWYDSKNWLKVFVHWLAHPIYSKISNYLDEIKNKFGLSDEIVEQEYNLSFTSSNESIFKASLIQSCIVEKIEKDIDYDFFIAGLDTSSCGNDFTVLTILGIKQETFHLVDFYRAKDKTSDYHLFKIQEKLNHYNPKAVFIETNSIGQIYLENLRDNFNCEGVFTSSKSKSEMINRFLYLAEIGKIKMSKKSGYVEEFLNFSGGSQSFTDDCVMSLLICLYGYFLPSHNKNVLNLQKFLI